MKPFYFFPNFFVKRPLLVWFLPFLLLTSIILLSFQVRSSEIPADFVDVHEIDPDIYVDMMYATPKNFLGRPAAGYQANICYLHREAANALQKANSRLKTKAKAEAKNLSLLVRDCYRPEKAVKDFVNWTQDSSHTEMKSVFYPDISKPDLIRLNYISPVSGHARGSTVDLTIVEVKPEGTLQELPMGTIVDFFGERSNTAFPQLSAEEKKNRALLLEIMEPEFKNYSKEWWHFVLKKEPLPNISYDFDIIKTSQDEAMTHLSDPKILGQLDGKIQGPLSLANLFRIIHLQNAIAIPSIPPDASSTGATLEKFNQTYGQFASAMSSDIARIIKESKIDWEKDITKTYQPAEAHTERGKNLRLNGNVTRIFNEKWLTSTEGKFILAGIVNRIDRKDFNPSTCGEVRFIYRLGYETSMNNRVYSSRMPFTVNMVFDYPNDGNNCRDAASLWKIGNSPSVERLLQGPLNFSILRFKQMEINAQIARFPSDLENDEHRNFAGQAIYWMRIFAISNGRMKPQKLENTPDVAGILKDKNKQQLLKDFIAKHLAQIDTGVFRLPDELLADLALTYSTLGSSRIANKPFNLLLSAKQAQEILNEYSAQHRFRFIGSGEAILERLNTSSCMGCHQSSSTAGFHFLGKDRIDFSENQKSIENALDGNRLQLPFSPHFYSEIPRRKTYIQRLAKGEAPDIFRPHPSAPRADWEKNSVKFQSAKTNMPCFIDGGDLAKAATWNCDASEKLSCKALVNNVSLTDTLGQCVPPSDAIFSGLSCRTNQIEDHTAQLTAESTDFQNEPIAYNLTSFEDRVSKDEQFYGLPEGKLNSFEYNCRPTRIGVPLGRITRACTLHEMSLEDFVKGKIPDEICAIVGGKGFEEMAKGYFDSRKFAAGVGRGMLNTCGPGRNCREDYICQEMPNFLSNERFRVKPETLQKLHDQEIGFCTPTYFIYQLRLDGHPNP